MMLSEKVAVIYGAGGAIGGAVARAFAREGAKLFLTGRLRAPAEAVAEDIVSAGGAAEAIEVDALDEKAVDDHLRSVIDKAGHVDISFNAIGIPDTNILGVPLVDLDVERFSLPITAYVTSYFLTARMAARRMIANKSGVIMTVTTLHSADRHPIGGRLRSGDGRQGGTHSRAIHGARTSWHSRGRSAASGHAGDEHDQGSLRASRQAIGNDLGAVESAAREQDTPATAHDARRDGQRGGLHGFRSRERDDGNYRQFDHGQPG
jgi:NAD(P)-dependent dehydrogenase (short-subunit alcohol dehydrogenase family)